MDYNHSYYCIIAYNEENKPIVLGLLNKVVTGIKNYRNTYRDLFKEIIVNTLKLRKIKYDHLEEHTVYIGKLNTIYEKVSRIYVELSRIEKLLGIYTEYNYSDDSEKFVTFKDVDRYY